MIIYSNVFKQRTNFLTSIIEVGTYEDEEEARKASIHNHAELCRPIFVIKKSSCKTPSGSMTEYECIHQEGREWNNV